FIPALLAALEKGAKMGLVASHRVGRRDGGFKKFQSRIANGVRGAILRDGTRDTACGLKAFRRDAFLALPYFDGLHRFLPAAFWIFSIGGGALLLVYALYRKDPVFIAGQGLGLFIYVRNLHFVLRETSQTPSAA